MNEFIEKLISRLEEIEEHCLDMHNWQGQSAIVEAKEIVNQLAEEYEREHIVDLCNQICDKADEIMQKRNGGWISVSEQAEPNENGQYIVYVQHYLNHNLYDISIIDWHGEWKKAYEWNVIAWMPVPEYQPKRDSV